MRKTISHTVTTQTEPNIKDHQKIKHLFTSELSVKKCEIRKFNSFFLVLRNIKRTYGVCKIFPLALG